MSQEQTNDKMNSVVNHGKNLVQKGNQRHIIIRKQDGEKVAEISLTIAAIIGAVLLFSGWGVPLIIAGVVFGIAAKLQIEVVRDLAEDENVIEVKIDQE